MAAVTATIATESFDDYQRALPTSGSARFRFCVFHQESDGFKGSPYSLSALGARAMHSLTLNLSRSRPWIAAMGLAFSSMAAANCGLDACPISGQPISGQPVTGKPMGSLLTDFRFTNVGSDHYTETTLGGQVNLGHRIALGARIPFIALSQANVDTTGMGNAVGFGNWSILSPESRPSMDLGLQLEIPTVSADELGDAHFLVLPTGRIGWNDRIVGVFCRKRVQPRAGQRPLRTRRSPP